jgi:hypothetical protein
MTSKASYSRFWLGLVFGVTLLPQGAEPLAKGHVFFQTDFEGPSALTGWSGGNLEPGWQSRQALVLESPAESKPLGAITSLTLPVEAMRGCLVYGSAMVKAENVSAKPNPWNGIKLMAALDGPDGKAWPQAPLGVGSFDWKKASFSFRVPANATKLTLVLGLEQVTGKVWFDNVKLTLARPPLAARPAPIPGPRFKGHNLGRLRGAMISPNATEEDLRVLGQEWKANLVRWQLVRNLGRDRETPLDEYDDWLEGELRKLDRGLEWCEQYGLMVVIDLHSPPGGKGTVSGYIGSDHRLFTDRAAQDILVAVWEKMARRYRDRKIVWGYDIANEPVEEVVEEGVDDWQALAERVAKAIYAIDKRHAIIVEAPPWGGPASLRDFLPLPVPNVVYSAHMYEPGAFTHQGVFDKNQKPVSYPGLIDGKMWDKAALEAALKPVIDFQKKYNAHIYLGEFSAIRWAPGDSAYQYLRDVIEIFEKYEWDWSYHAYREWNGWSVEHGPDPQNTRRLTEPTDRQKLLLEWYGKNRKP